MAGRNALDEEVWYSEVADLQVREGLSFSQACLALGIKFTSAKEEAKHERRKSYQKRYWATRNAYYNNIGVDPSLTKEVVMGVLARTLTKLEETGNFDKIATAAKTLSDIAGWTKDAPTVSIIGGMSQAELDAVKAKARELALATKVASLTKNDETN